jgi:hypothetical protein
VFHMDVVKVDRDVRYIASVSETCCRRLFKVFHLFLDVCCKRFDLDVAYVLHICCKSTFKIFQLFHSYVAVSVFMLQMFYVNVAYD